MSRSFPPVAKIVRPDAVEMKRRRLALLAALANGPLARDGVRLAVKGMFGDGAYHLLLSASRAGIVKKVGRAGGARFGSAYLWGLTERGMELSKNGEDWK
jgi:hypothetical protein